MSSSPILQDPIKPGTQSIGELFLKENNETLALLGSLLWLLHPRLARRTCEIMERIRQNTLKEPCLEVTGRTSPWWPTPFTAMGIISNKESLPHRDWKGDPQFYDLLTTLGTYQNGRFKVPGLGIHLQYNPGTVVAICGKLLMHAVPPVEGDRVCFAQYFHSIALQHHQRNPELQQQDYEGWMKLEGFEDVMKYGDQYDLLIQQDTDSTESSTEDDSSNNGH